MIGATVLAGRARALSPGFIVALCFGIAALEGYDIQAVGVAAPSMAPALHMNEAQIGLASSWAMIGLVLGAFVGGWFADRVGRKPVLVASVAWFGVFSLVTALVQSPDMLLVSRFLTGLGFGGAMPNMIAVASEISTRGKRGATVTTMFVGMPAGGALASLVTMAVTLGYLPRAFDWRLVFVVGGALPILLTPLTYFLLPETRPAHDAMADRNPARALFGEGRAGTTLLMWLAFAGTLVVTYLMLGWLPILVGAKGLTKTTGLFASFSFNAVSVAGGLLFGLLVDRFSFRWPLAVGYLGLGASMALLAPAGGAGQVIALSGAVGFCLLGVQYSLYALAPAYYAAAVRGTGVGAAVGAGRLGSIVGPMMAGALRQQHATAGDVLGYTLPVIAVAGAAAFILTLIGKPYSE